MRFGDDPGAPVEGISPRTWLTVEVPPRPRSDFVTSARVPTSERRYKVAEITAESRRGLRFFTRNYGGNPTTLVEVIGLHLATYDSPKSKLPPMWRRLADEAAELERQRRERTDDG